MGQGVHYLLTHPKGVTLVLPAGLESPQPPCFCSRKSPRCLLWNAVVTDMRAPLAPTAGKVPGGRLQGPHSHHPPHVHTFTVSNPQVPRGIVSILQMKMEAQRGW